MTETDIYTATSALIGVILLTWKQKRRFARTNQFGIERYSTFRGKIASKVVDGLLYVIGFVMTLSAAIVFFVEHGKSFPFLSLIAFAFIVFLFVGSTRNSTK